MSEQARRRTYSTDLTDDEWAQVEPLLRRRSGPGHPTELDLREVVNALMYLNRTGCPWRLLPHDFPNPNSVRYYFDQWTWDGTFARINTVLRKKDRVAAGRDPEPTLAIIDSQTAKTTEAGGERGFDGGKNTKGRKRQLLVDTRGNVLALVVHAADLQDREALVLLLDEFRDMFPRVVVILADEGYRAEWLDELSQEYGIAIQIVTKPADQVGFVVQKLRWIVERTIAWLNRYRRLSKDYECLAECSESMVYLASIRTMLKRLFPRRPADMPYRNKPRTPSAGATPSHVWSVAR